MLTYSPQFNKYEVMPMSYNSGRWTPAGEKISPAQIELQLEKLIETMAEKPNLGEIKDILTNTQKVLNRYRAVSNETIMIIELMKANDNTDLAEKLKKLHSACLSEEVCAQVK